ncbi:metallothionein-like protein LSC54 [Cucurbita maxima]|uniref:Metallothionein-like protein LSC54 n=1 Tax=Cucurbita maxima TaxID=3661 RepID=A0A6J1KD42_CUCMA|nr:metallothionein-like protein LSC54 [Cucurbita maxima]
MCISSREGALNHHSQHTNKSKNLGFLRNKMGSGCKCGDSCSCGDSCNCQSGSITEAFILNKDGCSCGSSCSCDPCNCK